MRVRVDPQSRFDHALTIPRRHRERILFPLS
jgi:hypothetical protein